MHKTTKIKKKIELLKEKMLLDDDSFNEYCDSLPDINNYPAYINNKNLLSLFYKKYDKASLLRSPIMYRWSINKEKLDFLITNNYFEDYGSLNIPHILFDKIKEKKVLRYIKEKYNEFSKNPNLYFKENYNDKNISKNGIKKDFLSNKIESDFRYDFLMMNNPLTINNLIYFLKNAPSLEKIDAMIHMVNEKYAYLLNNLSIDFYKLLLEKNYSLCNLNINFILFAKDKETIDFLINNGFILNNETLNKGIMEVLGRHVDRKNIIDNIFYFINDLNLKISQDIKENKDNILYKILRFEEEISIDKLTVLEKLGFNLVYEDVKGRVPRDKIVHLHWIKENINLLDFLVNKSYINIKRIFYKLNSYNNPNLILYIVKKYPEILDVDNIIVRLISIKLPSNIKVELIKEIYNTKHRISLLKSLEGHDFHFSKMTVKEKWYILKLLEKNKKDFDNKYLLFLNKLTIPMLDYVLKNFAVNVNDIDYKSENLLFKIQSVKRLNYLMDKKIDCNAINKENDLCFFIYKDKKELLNIILEKEFLLSNEQQVNLVKNIIDASYSLNKKKEIINLFKEKNIITYIKTPNFYKVKSFISNINNNEYQDYHQLLEIEPKITDLVKFNWLMLKAYLFENNDLLYNVCKTINFEEIDISFLNKQEKEELYNNINYGFFELVQKKNSCIHHLLVGALKLFKESIYIDLNKLDSNYLGHNEEWFKKHLNAALTQYQKSKLLNKIDIETNISVNKKRI